MKSLINRIIQGELFSDFTPEELEQLYTEVFPIAVIYDSIRYNLAQWNLCYVYYSWMKKEIHFEVESYYGDYSTDEWCIPVEILLSDNPLFEAKYKKAVNDLTRLYKVKNAAIEAVNTLSVKICDQARLISQLQLERNTNDSKHRA